MAYEKTVWVDDDGSGTVGTPFTAALMNNLENGIEDNLLAHDVATQSAEGTGELSWSHKPTAPLVRGVLVLVVQNGTAADQVTEVRYGSLTLRELPLSPFLHPTGSEDGVIHAYFAGTTVPQGSRTVSVKVSGADPKRAVCYTMTADADLTAQTAGLEASSVLNPSAGPTLRTGTEALAYAALHSGYDSIASVTSPTGVQDFTNDFGSQTAYWQHKALPSESAAMGWTAAAGEEGVIFTVAVRPIRDVGPSAAFPESGAYGDKCQITADSTNGIIWNFIHDGEGELPWKCIGGQEMFAETIEEVATSSTSFITEGSPSLVTPLKGDYMVETGMRYWNGTSNAYGYMSPKIGAAATSVENGPKDAGGGGVGMIGFRKKRITGIAAGTTIQSQVKVAAGTGFFSSRSLAIRPTRCA